MIRQGRSRRFAEGMATPSAIEDNWQNETGLRVTLKGAQLGQIAHLRESIELRVRSTKRIHLGAHRWEKCRPDSGVIYPAMAVLEAARNTPKVW